ncbi:unnamed protein product [Arabidopsis arenosa]|uniref:Jacalin-type lectin domain-containing protein n=1 Tax=Arabidopsis arenosa TaxID=38785 RepID=A0A8S2A643_ARAAE|nr:unnamed protein product [Arabidopsis arenosa]
MFRAGSVGKKSTAEYIDWDENDNEIEMCGDIEWDEKGRTKISRIYIAFDEVIRSFQFGYLENGALVLSAKYGPSEGYNIRVVRLNQDEYVTGLSGVLGMRGGIRNLTFHTNRGKHGPIGRSSDGHPSAYEIEIDPAISDPREFGGFFGSCSLHNLSSIGIYVNPNGTLDSEVQP